MISQIEMFRNAERKCFDLNNAFMEMVTHPTNPMTKKDLIKLIEKRPNVYGRFSGFIDKLD